MKSIEKRSIRKPRKEPHIDLNKLPPLNRIPRKTRLPKETRERKRSFTSMSKDQLQASHKTRLVEEVAARELLLQKTA